MAKDQETEEKIFDAARDVFQRNGFAGARMQEIADEAGINKSMLHYYFRTKDKLFQEVFKQSVKKVIPALFNIIASEGALFEKTSKVAVFYTQAIKENPHLPMFVLHEMHQNVERFKDFMGGVTPSIPQTFKSQIRMAVDNGEIKPISPENFLINLLSWCMFPFIAKNMITTVFELDEVHYQTMLNDRVELIPDLLFNGLLPRNGGDL